MKFKNLVAAILAGLLLYGQMGNVEAKVYDVTADETRKINAVIGENADFLSLQTRIAASSAMADKCAEEHVKPYFAAKGITLSDAQAQAVAFGALELGDVNAGKTGNNIYFNAAGHVYYDESMDYVYGNKKFINAYIATQGELAEIFRNMGPAFAGYAQYSNDDSAEILRAGNAQRQALYQRLVNMQEYSMPGAKLVVTGNDINFRSAPDTNSEILDVLQMDEELEPKDSSFEAAGRMWCKAINAKGDIGYVAIDYVRLAC